MLPLLLVSVHVAAAESHSKVADWPSSWNSCSVGTVPYPIPLVPKDPPGSLIYDPSFNGIIDPAGDTDSFVLDVDAGQTITLVASASGGMTRHFPRRRESLRSIVTWSASSTSSWSR